MRLAALLLLLTGGCRLATAPSIQVEKPALASKVDRTLTYADQVPALRNLRVEVQRGDLVIRANLDAPSPFWKPVYGKVDGGWTLEVFLDTDQDPDQAYRFECQLRPCDYADSMLVERGGYTDYLLGMASLKVSGGDLVIRAPLSVIHDRDGAMDWEIMTFAMQDSPYGIRPGARVGDYRSWETELGDEVVSR